MIESSAPPGVFLRYATPAHVEEIVDHATLLLDNEQRIIGGSRTVGRFFLLPAAEIIGRMACELLPGLKCARRPADRRYTAGEMARMRLSRVTLLAQRGDGSRIPVSVSLFETRDDDGTGAMLRVRHLHSTEMAALNPSAGSPQLPEGDGQ